jgi:hypothetical protein
MDFEVISQLIGSVGFPIAACCVMFYQNSKMQETLSSIAAAMSSMTDKIRDIETKLNKEEN